MSDLLLTLPGCGIRGADLAAALGIEEGRVSFRRFPDGESYLRVDTDVCGRRVAVLSGLHDPDGKFLSLLFLLETLRELGAEETGLVVPYLPYMRQDIRFQPGEAVTSAIFARHIGGAADWMVTIDPHLHRYNSLDEIYACRTRVLSAAPLVAEWIAREVENPLLIGPDAESVQWVSAVARLANAPFTVLEKIRKGDRDVSVGVPDSSRYRDRTPVLVDDIISSARTMIAVVAGLKAQGLRPPVCIGIHGLFGGDAYEALKKAGPVRIVTAETVPHETNAIPVTALLAEGVKAMSKVPIPFPQA